MDNSITPILLLASERSGTNLLRAIVSSHSQIASPSPFSMIDALASRYFMYARLEDKNHFQQLIEDSIELTQVHLNPWPSRFSVNDVKKKLKQNSFWDVFKVMNTLYTELENKKHWFSKEPSLFRHIYELAIHFPEAKFVYMVRDPRDVVSSIVKGGVHEQNVCNAAIRWRQEQELILNAYTDPVLRDRIFMLKYEDLIQNQEDLVKKLMSFVEINFEEQQLTFYKDKRVIEHSQKSEFWQNLSKPINQENSGKYRKSLSVKQIKLIESICWNEMKMLGYKTENQSPMHVSFKVKVFYRVHGRIKKMIKKLSWSQESKRQRQRSTGAAAIRNRKFY
ncbi:sulfotransferase family protein [Methylophaga thiooxydans]|uniref:sulfotransferase family protein n=1 Tax=Methylophaga thiooxydans TaxID=392484 RepID=UPI002354769B|nr:sulfotransferase [Methylophaga thiooxydans]